MLILSFLIQEQKKGKKLYYKRVTYYKKSYSSFEKHVDANDVMLAKDLKNK